MKPDTRTGIYLALTTALISGVSVYLNKFAVAVVPDVLLLTTLKNTLVGLALLAAFIPLAARGQHGVHRRNVVPLAALAVIGGSVPFLLFFRGLAAASAPSAALIHKSLFLWVALFAAPLLGESLGGWTVLGLGLLAGGQLLAGWPKAWGWGGGETLILIATLLWAVETIIARRLLPNIPTLLAATARMAGGAALMWAFLFTTGAAGGLLTLTAGQWAWVGLTSIFLVGYVTTWYAALKLAPAAVVSGVLTLGAVITAGLALGVEGQPAAPQPALGLGLIALGAGLLVARQLRRRQRVVVRA
jgi:drug/metabolite transporter (DMT)-like permease